MSRVMLKSLIACAAAGALIAGGLAGRAKRQDAAGGAAATETPATPDASERRVTIDNFAQKYAEALCEKNFTCCDQAELTGKTQSQCVSDNQAAFSFLISSIKSSQAQNRASYSSTASAMCVDSLKAMRCDEMRLSSHTMTRMNSARSGASMPASFSTAQA